jgi:hypothetical protein
MDYVASAQVSEVDIIEPLCANLPPFRADSSRETPLTAAELTVCRLMLRLARAVLEEITSSWSPTI